jgi:hypothetical protein
MPIITKDQSQDKASNRLDRNLNKKKKQKPLSEEEWSELTNRGASLAEQIEWLKIKKQKNDYK